MKVKIKSQTSAVTEVKGNNKEIDTPKLQTKYSTNEVDLIESTRQTLGLSGSQLRTELQKFIQLIRHNGLISIGAISTRGHGLVGQTFEIPSQLDECVDYIISQMKHTGINLHFAVNEPNKKVQGKLNKTDIKEVSLVHVDIDPNGKNYDTSRKELLGSIDKIIENLKPNLVLDSGHGIQIFWKHKTPMSIAEGEDINKRMIEHFSGDKGTWNADRLMRMPFTWNYPTETKIAKGYPSNPCIATVLYWGDDNV